MEKGLSMLTDRLDFFDVHLTTAVQHLGVTREHFDAHAKDVCPSVVWSVNATDSVRGGLKHCGGPC